MSLTTDFLLAEKAKEYDNCGCTQELGSGIIHLCEKHELEYREADAEMEYYAAMREESETL